MNSRLFIFNFDILSVCPETSFPHASGGNPCLKRQKELDSGLKEYRNDGKQVLFGQALLKIVLDIINRVLTSVCPNTVQKCHSRMFLAGIHTLEQLKSWIPA